MNDVKTRMQVTEGSLMNDARRMRGMEIAATSHVRREGEFWMVPSQSRNRRYAVAQAGSGFCCSCPDFESRRLVCKHMFAVLFAMKRETNGGGLPKVTAPVRVALEASNACEIKEQVESEWLTPVEFAELANVSNTYVRKAIETGRIIANNISLGKSRREWRIHRSQLERLLPMPNAQGVSQN